MTTMTNTGKSAFAVAIDDYLLLPSRKKRASFIQTAISGAFYVKAEEVQMDLLSVADDAKQKMSRRLLWPIFEAVCDYDAVISTLVQADPMPSALIWGGLKAVLDCFKRYKSIVEKLETHLKRLTTELSRMKEYEELFPKSGIMHELLVQNYIQIIQFWVKVESFCSSSTMTIAAKSVVSTSTKRLTEVIEAITFTGNEIAKMVPIIQERLRRGEKEDMVAEQRKAGMMLTDLVKFQAQQRKESKRMDIVNWLHSKDMSYIPNEGNFRHQRNGESVVGPGSGQWLLENPLFKQWANPTDQLNTIWLHGDPGMGKSVICSRAVAEVQKQDPLATVAFQYYSFDEENDHPTFAYRNLAAQLFDRLDDHDVLDDIIDITRFPDTEVAFQTFIELLLGEAKHTYIFLDGIDEKAIDAHGKARSKRWSTARGILRFLINLTQQPRSRLKLWCSSQDQQQVRDELSAMPHIHMSESTNSKDIEAYFEDALRKKFEARFAKFDAESKAFVLQELKSQARGNFLWASMMLRTIETARSMKDLKDKLKEGLPEDFQKYLLKQVQALPQSPFVVNILSLLTYAMRPLSVEELCEAIQVCETEAGCNLSEDTRIVHASIIESCAPLVRLDQIKDKEGKEKGIFTLCHGSVKSFLTRNPGIFQSQSRSNADDVGVIEPSLFADLCLQYLQQPRYSELMKDRQGTFLTHCGQDVTDHYLLVYCARYWGKHLEKVKFNTHLGTKVEEFLRSKEFMIYLQAQTLFVGGAFYLWVDQWTHQISIPRAFPSWFAEKHSSGSAMEDQYSFAIREWGYYLSLYSSVEGMFPGQLDHCQWQSLGSSNFLSRIPSRVKSFVFADGFIEQPRLEYISSTGKDFISFMIDPNGDDSSNIHYDQWRLKRARKPKLKETRRLFASDLVSKNRESLSTRHPPCISLDSILRISDDGQFLHTGTNLYSRNSDQAYDKIERYFESMESVEELGSGPGMIALASRKRLIPPTTSKMKSASSEVVAASSPSESDDSSSESDSDSANGSSSNAESNGHETGQQSVQQITEHCKPDEQYKRPESAYAFSFSGESLPVESKSKFRGSDTSVLEAVIDDTLSDFGSDLESITPGSARESWSESSSKAPSDEIIEDAAWNDWDSDDDPFDSHREILGEVELNLDDTRSISSKSSDSSFLTRRSSDTNSGPPKPKSRWVEKFEPSSEYDDIPPKSEQLREVEGQLQLSLPQFRADRICRLQVLSSAPESSNKDRLLSFAQRSTGLLLESPPVFHPQGDLVVWPTGCGEILFGDVKNKTYFTRRLSSGRLSECLVSVKVSFSTCGEYLHLATIWAQKCPCGNDERCPVCQRTRGWGVCLRPEYTPTFAHPTIHLVLHLTTHKLSKTKLARSPPKLIHSSCLTFDSGFEALKKVYERPLQFTLTWTPHCLYVTTNNRQLQVFRVPLFKFADTEVNNNNGESLSKVCENDGDVFLPHSTKDRRVHFFPTEQRSPQAKSIKRPSSRKNHESREEIVATIVLSSKFVTSVEPLGTAVTDIRREASMPPQVLYLTKSQLGDFTPLEYRQYRFKERMKAESNRGGQLLGMFEKPEKCRSCGRVLLGFDLISI